MGVENGVPADANKFFDRSQRRFAAGDSVITRKMGVPVIKMYEYSVQDQELLGQPATVCD